MWKVYKGDQYKYYMTFQEARDQFRETIKSAVGADGIEKYIKLLDSHCQKYDDGNVPSLFKKLNTLYGISKYINVIDTYCRKYYGSTIPRQFEELKTFLINYVTDPNYPADPDNFKFEAYEDENVHFYVGEPAKTLYITTKNKNIRGLFLEGRISIQLTNPFDAYTFSLQYEQVNWGLVKVHTEAFKLVGESQNGQSGDSKAASKNEPSAKKEKPFAVENFISGKSYAYATLRGAQNKMRSLVAKEFGAEGVEKLTKQIDRYCKAQYPDGMPKEIEELKTILTKLVTDPNFPSDPKVEMDLFFVDENLEILTLPSDGTLNILITNPKMKTKFPEANIIAKSEVGGIFTLSNGRDAESDPAYVGIDIEVYDEDLYEDDGT